MGFAEVGWDVGLRELIDVVGGVGGCESEGGGERMCLRELLNQYNSK